MNTRDTSFGRFLAVVGAVCQLALIIALLRLAPSLHNFASSLALGGIGDPSALVGAFEEFFAYCAVEFVISLVGLVLLCVALAGSGYRARWFFWFLVLYGGFLLFVVPVGTVFGLVFLGYCILHRSAFPAPSTVPPAAA